MLPVISRDDFALPTVYTSYKFIEDYLEEIEQSGNSADLDGLIRPIDALAFHLLLALMPTRANIVDFAATTSRGTSTVLCLCRSNALHVVSVLAATEDAERGWRRAMQDYLSSVTDTHLAPHHEVNSEDNLHTDSFASSTTMVLVPTTGRSTQDVVSHVARSLDRGRNVTVALLSLGKAGVCDVLSALVSKYHSKSSHRFVLIRDQASAFHECQLGLVFHRGHPFQNDLVSRLQQLFTGNFSFLSLTRQVCERAIEIAQGDQIDAPALLARARLIVAERERELSTVKFNGTVNLASRLKSLRARWLPDGSLRHRICRKIVRILRIGRSSGIRGIAARIVKRLCHPFRRTIADK